MAKTEYYLLAGAAVLVVLAMNKESIVGAYSKFTQRGIRNNNAGNLTITNIAWQGKVPLSKNTDGRFEQFTSPEYGLRAMYKDLKSDIVTKGQNTIRKLITSYAPAFENDTKAYIAAVAKSMGKGADALLSSNDYLPLMKAIIKHENGVQPYDDAILNKAISLA